MPVYFEPRLIKVGLADGRHRGDLDRGRRRGHRSASTTPSGRGSRRASPSSTPSTARRSASRRWPRTSWRTGRTGAAGWRTFIEAPGKAIIVGGTREICAKLYAAIVALRPDWHSDDLDKGKIKVVYSGTAVRRAAGRPTTCAATRRTTPIKERLKDADDELEIVIVKDMMLTGFDSPPLHTLYLDRPLKGALLMQTLARVNRTFRGKEDGLLVAYAPLAENLAQGAGASTPQADQAEQAGRARTSTRPSALDRRAGRHAPRAAGRLRLAGRAERRAARRPGSTPSTGAVNYLRDPATPGNQVADGEETLAAEYRTARRPAGPRVGAVLRVARPWPTCAPRSQFYEEVRVWMAKFDAEERQASGEPVPEEIQRLLGELIADVDVVRRGPGHLRGGRHAQAVAG